MGIIHGDHGIKVSVTCPCGTNEVVACDTFPEVKFVYDKLPLWDQHGKLVTKHVASWNNLTQKVKRSFQVGVLAASRPKGNRPDSLVLRVTMDARFCSKAAWKKLVAQPGNHLRTWIAGVAPANTKLVLDTWAWELQRGASGDEIVVKGYFRIKKDDAVGHLLAASGRQWEDKRCFWEALDWTTTPNEGWGKKPFVKWIEKEKGEQDLDYAVRAESLGGTHGLAREWRQLGLRSMSPFEGERPSTRLWVLKNPPRIWDMSEIEPFLSSAGFTSIAFVSKNRDRLGTSWMFRAQRTDQETYLQLL